MTTRLADNNDFNKDTRHTLMKLEVYLDGDTHPPLVIDKENYLISATLLEETGSDSSWPLGEVSANELTFQLYSHHGLFCPTNPESPYYGKIKSRVKVKPYFKPADEAVVEWIPMGVFYVTDWVASITGIVASVVAHDIFRDIFKEKPIDLYIKRNTTYKAFYEDIFNSLGISCVVSDYFDKPLPWAFVDESNSRVIKNLASSDMTICTSNRLGIVEVKHISENANTIDTLTDMNQIKDASTTQSITKNFDGVTLTYTSPQLVPDMELVNAQDIVAPPGTFVHDAVAFAKGLNYQATSVKFVSPKNVLISGFNITPKEITVETNNPEAAEVEGRLIVSGTLLDKVLMKMGEESLNPLSLKNDFIQTADRAREYVSLLEAFISSDRPEVDLLVRCNPLLQLGDKIVVSSTKFKLNYTGRIKQMFFKYDGSLDGNIKLLDNSLFGGA